MAWPARISPGRCPDARVAKLGCEVLQVHRAVGSHPVGARPPAVRHTLISCTMACMLDRSMLMLLRSGDCQLACYLHLYHHGQVWRHEVLDKGFIGELCCLPDRDAGCCPATCVVPTPGKVGLAGAAIMKP